MLGVVFLNVVVVAVIEKKQTLRNSGEKKSDNVGNIVLLF